MFIQAWEAREERLQRAREAMARVLDYPVRVRVPKILQPSPARRRQRGVYELEFAPPGRRAFHMVASTGDVGYVDFPEHWASRDLIKNLWRRLDREDPPQTQLRIIPASAQSVGLRPDE